MQSPLSGRGGGHSMRPTYIDSDVYTKIIVFPPRVPVLVVFLGSVMADYQCIFWQLFVETFLGFAVYEKEEGLGDLSERAQGHKREERPHICCAVESG